MIMIDCGQLTVEQAKKNRAKYGKILLIGGALFAKTATISFASEIMKGNSTPPGSDINNTASTASDINNIQKVPGAGGMAACAGVACLSPTTKGMIIICGVGLGWYLAKKSPV
jgi:hypothetical protein